MTVIVNGEPRAVPDGATVADLVAPGAQTRGVAIALDGEVVPRSEWSRTAVHEGARVEIVVAVQGG